MTPKGTKRQRRTTITPRETKQKRRTFEVTPEISQQNHTKAEENSDKSSPGVMDMINMMDANMSQAQMKESLMDSINKKVQAKGMVSSLAKLFESLTLLSYHIQF